MLAKLNFLQSKYYIFIIAFIAIIMQPLSAANLKSCDYRVFNIKTTEKVSGLELLTQIADSCNFSIIVKDSFAAKQIKKDLYGINIKNLSLEEIFGLIISDNDLFYKYDKNFLKISALKTKTFKVDYVTSVRQGTANLNASVDATITAGDTGTKNTANGDNSIKSVETFDFWKTVMSEVTAIMNTGSEEYTAKAPIVNQNAGLVTVTGTKTQLDRVGKYLKTMQKSLHKEVIIDVSILSVDLEKGHETGINWSKFNLSINNNGGTGIKATDKMNFASSLATTTSSTVSVFNEAAFSMAGLISFLNTNGNTEVISSPKVLSMNNQQALITIGDNINYRVESSNNSTNNASTVASSFDNFSIFVGVLLNITPQITDDNEIILRINPSVSNFKYSSDDVKQIAPRVIAPDTTEKKLSTIVKVKNGNTIILGGLIAHSEALDKSNVPVLSDIPILGNAFKHTGVTKTTKELVFVITPRIIGPKDNTKTTLKDLGFSKRIYDK